jgi:formylglycine-generating enzyme required for sulfatase activity
MVYVTNGIFRMGSDSGGEGDEKPDHDVTLNGFWIDRAEVTNAQYAKCVSAGKCNAPSQTKSFTRSSYYGNKKYANFPVIFVSWDDANTYCAWAGGQLPTEAQWEYAARGPQRYTYPWGNDPPNDTLLNFNSTVGDTSAVGLYPSGASWAGALDLSGDVWEWVQDWYGPYPASPQTNPTGPVSGTYKVLRGGSWTDAGGLMRSTLRHHDTPDLRNGNIGFRCAAAESSK